LSYLGEVSDRVLPTEACFIEDRSLNYQLMGRQMHTQESERGADHCHD